MKVKKFVAILFFWGLCAGTAIGYGAVEMGEHRFTHMENGKELVAVFKFTHVWQFANNEWKVTRVVSVGH